MIVMPASLMLVQLPDRPAMLTDPRRVTILSGVYWHANPRKSILAVRNAYNHE